MSLMHVPRSIGLSCVLAFAVFVGAANARDLRVPLPKRSKPTPVQQLNRNGVKAIEKHDYTKAKKLFFQAYLLDPNDPFTLNNLGYISELEGDIDRAQRFYDLAAQQPSDALVDIASTPEIKGQRVSEVAGDTADTALQINRINVAATGLLLKGRAPEADLLLQQALKLDARNPFTLNNMGFAKEKEGELGMALSYYTTAANRHSSEPVMVTIDKSWRGRPISEVAADNAKKLRKLIQKEETDISARVARLNLSGVSAMNRNDRRSARSYFQQAYKLDPNDAFTLNNMGFVAEMDGDRETAQFYYDKAAEAKRNNARINVATRKEAEGRRVGEVAQDSDSKVQASMEAAIQAKRREGGPIVLKRRDNAPAIQPTQTPDSQPPPQ